MKGSLWKEVIGDDTPALESVLDVLEDRKALLAELQDLEAAQKAGQEVSSDRLSAIYAELEDIDADAKPAAAAEILHGLGFTRKMQEAPTKSFSGGWRMRLALAQVPTLNITKTHPTLLLLNVTFRHFWWNQTFFYWTNRQTCWIWELYFG